MMLSIVLALLLDALLGEARRWHPLVGFGRIAGSIEHRLHGGDTATPLMQRLRGVAALLLALSPVLLLTWIGLRWQSMLVDALVLYFTLGLRSLHDHARPVADALHRGDEAEARRLTARMVSRDEDAIEPAPATVESVLENGNDAVFGALFWFVIAGAPGALLYRLANTLDAMWGYKTPRFLYFGWAAARFDDLLNWPPARLTALSYALVGQTALALRCWRAQAAVWKSGNAGAVMAAGAGALGLRLGGPARYHGIWESRPALGAGAVAQAGDISRSLALVRYAVGLWLIVLAAATLVRT